MRDFCRISGTGEVPWGALHRGGSPPTLRKASIMRRKLTGAHSFILSNKVCEQSLFISPSLDIRNRMNNSLQ